MTDEERAAKIERLQLKFSEATARRTALTSELQEVAAKIGEIRKALGNPFFYSGVKHGRPENADKSIVKYTGQKSHEAGLRLVGDLRGVDLELNALQQQLHDLGVSVEYSRISWPWDS